MSIDLSSTASTMLNIAVQAPMPIARVETAASASNGSLARRTMASRHSLAIARDYGSRRSKAVVSPGLPGGSDLRSSEAVDEHGPVVDGGGVAGEHGGAGEPLSIAAARAPHEIRVDRQRSVGHFDAEGLWKRLVALDLELDAAVADVHQSRLRVLDFGRALAEHRLSLPATGRAARLAPPCADDRRFDQAQELLGGNRLGDVMRAELHGLGPERRIGEAGHHDAGNAARRRRDELQSVVSAKPHVRDQQIRRILCEQAATVDKNTGRPDRVPGILEECRHPLTRGVVILDKEDPGATARHPSL